MFHDSVAMKGFGRMFNNFWQKQLVNANTIRKYNLQRGGIAETPYYRVRYYNISLRSLSFEIILLFFLS